MPNKHAADTVCVSVWCPRTLKRRLDKKAKKQSATLTDLVINIYTHATSDIELTPEDYRKIAEETEEASRGVDRRSRASRAKRKAG